MASFVADISAKVLVSGGDRILRKLQTLSGAVAEGAILEPSMFHAAQQIVDRAKELCPVANGPVHGHAPGHLRDSIKLQRYGQSQSFVRAEVNTPFGVLLANASYAGWVEYGTVHAAAKPFLRPAWDEYKDAVYHTAWKMAAEKIASYLIGAGIKSAGGALAANPALEPVVFALEYYDWQAGAAAAGVETVSKIYDASEVIQQFAMAA